MENILVAEKQLTGRYCGYYRVYSKENPIKTLAHFHYLHLPDFLDSCIISPIGNVAWDKCEVVNPEETYTVEFDLDFRRELAKEILSRLYSVNTNTPKYVSEDIIDEVQSKITDAGKDVWAVEDILHDYLGLDTSYAWIFGGDNV